MTPIETKGIKKIKEVFSKLSNPFSEGVIYTGLVYKKSNRNDAPLPMKLVKVYMPIDCTTGFLRRLKI